jgi:methionyl-tRNA formyltransferase
LNEDPNCPVFFACNKSISFLTNFTACIEKAGVAVYQLSMRLIFMGTPEFAVPALAQLVRDGHEVAAVFTQPDKPVGRGKQLHAPPVKTFALEHNITVHQPAKIKTNDEVRAVFESIKPDACIVAAYGKILPEWLLKIPRLGCINIHASLLPKYRGAAPINWAIANGENEAGVTLMQMDAGMDTGAMLSKRATPIAPDETAIELTTRLSQIGAELLSETLPQIENGEITPEAQDETQVTYAPILKREDGLINWQMSATEIANRVRAFQPWPSVFTMFRGARLIFWRAREVSQGSTIFSEQMEPAKIVAIDKSGFIIRCADASLLQVEEVQLEGKRRVPARDFLNGSRVSVGDSLGDSAAT